MKFLLYRAQTFEERYLREEEEEVKAIVFVMPPSYFRDQKFLLHILPASP